MLIGCNQHRQVRFLEYEEIPIDFWDHEYDTVLLGGDNYILDVGKGIAKCYKLIHAQ